MFICCKSNVNKLYHALFKQCCVQDPAGQKYLNGSCLDDEDYNFEKDEDQNEDKVDTIAFW